MIVKIDAGTLNGSLSAPPSKSMAHRMLICSALCNGESIIHGIADSEDILATIDCLSALGAKIERDGDTVRVLGTDIKNPKHGAMLNCRESGSTLRFLIPLALMSGKQFKFSGSEKLFSRPLGIYETICANQGLCFHRTSTDSLSVGGILSPGEYKVEGNISSQFISGLLFVLPLFDKDSRIIITTPIESRSYLDLTVEALKMFGVEVLWDDERTLYIKGGQSYRAQNVTVEGDYSNAAFFAAMNLLGSKIELKGLRGDSLQGDKIYVKYFEMLSRGTPTIHIGNCPDLGPVLMAVAAAGNGAVFCGTHRLRLKESDRGTVMAEELSKFGTSVAVYEDSIVVYPKAFHVPVSRLSGHNDHRIVMALSVLLTLTGGEIEGAEAVRKSLPEYFDIMKSLGGNVSVYEA